MATATAVSRWRGPLSKPGRRVCAWPWSARLPSCAPTGIDAPILLLSEPPLESVAQAVALGLRLTVYRAATARAMSEAGGGRLHVKVDTGMHRVGVAPHDLKALLTEIGALPGLAA